MENALSTLSVLPVNKTELKTFIASAKGAILSGYNNPLEALKSIKMLETIAKELRGDKEVMEYVQSESDNYNEKAFNFCGCDFQKREIPVYDYSACEDSELDMMENNLKLLSEQIKARKKFLITIKDHYINQETGEVIKPPVKTIKSSIAITIK